LGCDICGKGIACTLKTNLSDLGEIFNVRDLKLKPFDFSLEVSIYNFSKEKGDIEKLRDIYEKIKEKSNFCIKSAIDYDEYDEKFGFSSWGLSSVFDNTEEFGKINDSSDVDSVKLCPICFNWFESVMGNDSSNFKKIHPFNILWYDYFEDNACHFLDFEDDEIKNMEDFLKLIDYSDLPEFTIDQ
jgi:hypothetical protein